MVHIVCDGTVGPNVFRKSISRIEKARCYSFGTGLNSEPVLEASLITNTPACRTNTGCRGVSKDLLCILGPNELLTCMYDKVGSSTVQQYFDQPLCEL